MIVKTLITKTLLSLLNFYFIDIIGALILEIKSYEQ